LITCNKDNECVWMIKSEIWNRDLIKTGCQLEDVMGNPKNPTSGALIISPPPTLRAGMNMGITLMIDDCFRCLEIGRLGVSEVIIKILQAS